MADPKKIYFSNGLLIIFTVCLLICQNATTSSGETVNNEKLTTGSTIQKIFKGLMGIAPTKKHVIGCILPFSGKHAIYGQKLLHGIELALDEFNSSTDAIPLTLIVKDSKADPLISKKAVEDLVYQEGAIAIIGPLLGSPAKAASKKAEKLRVPIITLTQREDIAGTGKYVFRNFLTPSLQVKTLTTYAIETRGLNRFVILYPQNIYGEKFMDLFWNEVDIHNREVLQILSYEEDQTDFGDVIKEMVKLPPFDEKREVMVEEVTEGEEKKEPKPIIDFDAIFIPDSYKKIGLIASQLAFYDVKGVCLLGTNLWNSPQLPKMAGNFLQESIFVDSFFQGSSFPFVKKFIADFKLTFGEEPGTLEAHSYDITSLIIYLLNDKQVNSRKNLKDELLKVKYFPGVTGITSFSPSGEVEKTLYFLTVRGGRVMECQ